MKRIDVMRWLLAVAVIFMTATAVAQTLTVTGPTESLAGDLVVLTIETEAAADTPPAWSVTPPETLDGKYRICDDGKTVVFASRLAGTYYFTVAANVGGKLEIVTHRLDNIGVDPAPSPTPLPPVPPVPEPTPEPKPDPAAEISALRQFAATKAVELVRSQYFDREKQAMAESFLTTAKQIDEREIDTPEKARTKQRDNSRRYLSSVTRNSWQTWSAWDAAVSKQLAEIDAASTLSVGQIGQAYKQIGLGLQASGFGRPVSGTSCETGNCPR